MIARDEYGILREYRIGPGGEIFQLCCSPLMERVTGNPYFWVHLTEWTRDEPQMQCVFGCKASDAPSEIEVSWVGLTGDELFKDGLNG